MQEAGSRNEPDAVMSLRRIDDEVNCCTYVIEPIFAIHKNEDDDDRRTLVDLVVVKVEIEFPDGSEETIEGDAAAQYASRVREMLRDDDALIEDLERPPTVYEQVRSAATHLQRMRDLRRRLKICRNLDQDAG